MTNTPKAPLLTMSDFDLTHTDEPLPANMIGVWCVYIRQLRRELDAQREQVARLQAELAERQGWSQPGGTR